QPEGARATKRGEEEIRERLLRLRGGPPGASREEEGTLSRQRVREEPLMERQLSLLPVAPRRGHDAEPVQRFVDEMDLGRVRAQELRQPSRDHAKPFHELEA